MYAANFYGKTYYGQSVANNNFTLEVTDTSTVSDLISKSPSVTTYDPVGNASRIGTEGVNNNVTPTAVDNISNSGFKVFHSGVSRISFHWIADAEL